MLRSAALFLAMLVSVSAAPGVAQQAPQQAPASTDLLCSEPYACVDQPPLTEAEILASLRYLQLPTQASEPPALEVAKAPSIATSVRR